ncbi:MAG TPA: adenosylcobinamide-GDP ribazoletransferase [Acidimicrobiia bacterium]|nr:adenosylcobinamide-GDP ribazoletransferase [Acidimicrobiia bacterium]
MREALSLLSTLGGARVPTARAVPWFPVVGAVLGAVVGVAWWGAAEVWPPAVAAAVVIAVDLALTGMLHVDGLADAADGLLPHASRERRLEIMRTPGVGAFAVASVTTVLLARVAAFASVDANVAVVVAVWIAARTVAALALARVPYARDDGLAAALLATTGSRHAVTAIGGGALVGALAIGVLGDGLAGGAGVATAVAAAVATVAFARRRLGGFTGDVLGAAILLGETAGLLAWSARW